MEIETLKELKKIIKIEKKKYLNTENKHDYILKIIKNNPDIKVWKFIKQMRKTSYLYHNRKKNIIYLVRYLINVNIMNRKGRKIGIETGENVFDVGIKIYHSQGIVINGNAKIGKNCRLYGDNCIGNNGLSNECPMLGDNIKVCVGAKILGDIYLANNITVAAGAVVLKSCSEENAILGRNSCKNNWLQ